MVPWMRAMERWLAAASSGAGNWRGPYFKFGSAPTLWILSWQLQNGLTLRAGDPQRCPLVLICRQIVTISVSCFLGPPGNRMKFDSGGAEGSPHPYGARDLLVEAIPGFRCAPPWAIFDSSLRDARSSRRSHPRVPLRSTLGYFRLVPPGRAIFSSKPSQGSAALHPGLFSTRPSGTRDLLVAAIPGFRCAPRWAVFAWAIFDSSLRDARSSRRSHPRVPLRSTLGCFRLGYFRLVPPGRRFPASNDCQNANLPGQ